MILANGAEVLLIPAVFIAMGIAFLIARARSNSIIDQWAAENGYEVLHSEERFLRKGPFFFRSTRGQTVYWVRVRDADGRERTGYVRCGGFFLGLWSSKATVEWDD